jgi:hypothetical protein
MEVYRHLYDMETPLLDLAALVELIDAIHHRNPLDPAALRPIRNAIETALEDLECSWEAAKTKAHASINWGPIKPPNPPEVDQ